MTPPPPAILNAAQVDPHDLDVFLSRVYPPAKAAFLREHGAWLHGGDHHRLALLVDEEGGGRQIAGYCAVIPGRVWAAGAVRDALWWVDLVIAPEFRGRGLQTLFDDYVRSQGRLLLGFPNDLAARIHRKHGWGVRSDLSVFLAPFQPASLRQVRGARGIRGAALRLGGLAFNPFAAAWRAWLAWGARRGDAWRWEDPSPEGLAAVFARGHDPALFTTWRDAEYLAWRFFQAPYRDQIRFYAAGARAQPSIVLVSRWLEREGRLEVRLLDWFGDLHDRAALEAAVRFALGDAARAGAVQMTALAVDDPISPLLRRCGFLIRQPTHFCWKFPASSVEPHSPPAGPSLDGAPVFDLAAPAHWTLADSDNDEPV